MDERYFSNGHFFPSLHILKRWVIEQGRPAQIVTLDNGDDVVSIPYTECDEPGEITISYRHAINIDEARAILNTTTY